MADKPENDWSGRHARLTAELLGVSFLLLLVAKYYDPAHGPIVLGFNLDRVPHTHLIAFLVGGWIYLLVHFGYRTFDEISSTYRLPKRASEVKRLLKRARRESIRCTQVVEAIELPPGHFLSEEWKDACDGIESNFTILEGLMVDTHSSIDMIDDQKWRELAERFSEKLQSLANGIDALSGEKEVFDEQKSDWQPKRATEQDVSILAKRIGQFTWALASLNRVLSPNRTNRFIERIVFGVVFPVAFAHIMIAACMPEILAAFPDIWNQIFPAAIPAGPPYSP